MVSGLGCGFISGSGFRLKVPDESLQGFGVSGGGLKVCRVSE